MGQKVSPIAFRLGRLKPWKSRWLASKKNYRHFLQEDVSLRAYILKKLKDAGIASVDIERSANLINIIISTSRPGMIIGRGGTGVEDLKKELAKIIDNKPFKVTIEETKNPEANAQLAAHTVAEALEKRMPFRRVLKQSLERVRGNR
ncbi:MAG: 30S ribosomal protein S3, partial [bacterium]|nr:30S ribosomal protein S3 [bacterium]